MALAALAAACSSSGSSDAGAPATTAPPPAADGAAHQLGSITALNEGRLAGVGTVGQLRAWGDLGLGTYAGLDGEMVVLDGEVWQVPVDGVPRRAGDDQATPFAQVVPFRADVAFPVVGPVSCADLGPLIDAQVGPGALVALRVDGAFGAVQARSVPAQSPPYPPLADVVATQQVTFDLGPLAGTLVGFRASTDLSSVSATGYHFHFLSEDRAHGGHALSCTVDAATVQAQVVPGLDLAFEQP